MKAGALLVILAAAVPMAAVAEEPVTQTPAGPVVAEQPPAPAPPVLQAHDLLARIQAVATAQERRPLPTAEEIGSAATALSEHLESHPQDVDALIALAGLQWLLISSRQMTYQAGDAPGKFKEPYAPVLGLLDRALSLDPNRADAHYWKALVCGTVLPDVSGELMNYSAIDLDQAIRSARSAVQLAPLNVSYREALASYLIQDHDGSAAADVLKDVQQGRHAMYVMLRDWELVPLPDGAGFSAALSSNFAQMQAERGAPGDFAGIGYLAVRVYFIAMPASEIEAFYQRQWPKFKLKKDNSDPQDPELVPFKELFLRSSAAGLQIERRMRSEPAPGFRFMLVEIHDPLPELRATFPITVGDVFCILTLINTRS